MLKQQKKIINDACGDEEAKKPADDADPKDDDDDGKDGKKDDEADKGAKDGCDGKATDEDTIAKIVEAAVTKALDSAKIDDKVDAAVKKALKLDEGAGTPEAKGAATDADITFNAEDCLPNGWGRR